MRRTPNTFGHGGGGFRISMAQLFGVAVVLIVLFFFTTNNILIGQKAATTKVVDKPMYRKKTTSNVGIDDLYDELLDDVDDVELDPATPSPQPVASSTKQPSRAATAEDIIAATAFNAPFFDRAKNFVGSVHRWEPNMTIVIVDLGMDPQQIDEAKCWKNVEIIPFDFAQYPNHVRELGIFAWKPLVMQLLLKRYKAIFYTDPAVEYRKPIPMIKKQIIDKGYWFVHQEGKQTNLRCCGPVNELCFDGTVAHLGFDKAKYTDKYMCAGGMQGYVAGSSAHKDVLMPTAKCALDASCIATPGSSLGNHRYDQCVFSLHINKEEYNYTCERDERFFAYPQTVSDLDVDACDVEGPAVLHMARGRSFGCMPMVKLKAECQK